MKLTKKYLKQLIKEELEKSMSEVKTTPESRDANQALTAQYDLMKKAQAAVEKAEMEHEKATNYALRNLQGRNFDGYADSYMYKARAEFEAAKAIRDVAVETYKTMHKKIKGDE